MEPSCNGVIHNLDIEIDTPVTTTYVQIVRRPSENPPFPCSFHTSLRIHTGTVLQLTHIALPTPLGTERSGFQAHRIVTNPSCKRQCQHQPPRIPSRASNAKSVTRNPMSIPSSLSLMTGRLRQCCVAADLARLVREEPETFPATPSARDHSNSGNYDCGNISRLTQIYRSSRM